MREIKYRAFVDERLRDVTSIHWDNGEIYSISTTRGTYDLEDYPEIVLMQGTGIKDMNEEEIFEDDIIEFTDSTGSSCKGTVYFNYGSFEVDLESFKDINNIIIVGNIYE